MAYFSNSTEGEVFEAQCNKCKYGERACPIALVQIEFNYDACNNKTARDILDTLVKNDGTCAMFTEFKHDLACGGQNVNTGVRQLTIPGVSCPLCGRGNGVTQKMIDTEYYVRAYINKHDKPPTYRNVAKHFDIAVCASHARLRHCRELMRARANGS